MATLIDDPFTYESIFKWEKMINRPLTVEYLFDHSVLEFELDGYPVYLCKDAWKKGKYDVFFIKRPKDFPAPAGVEIVFYSQVQKSNSRNGLFKPGGMHQSLIWKYINFMRNSMFGTRFVQRIFGYYNNLLMTDMQQTRYGMGLWLDILKTFCHTHDCYYAFSTPGTKQFVLKIESEDDVDRHYVQDIVCVGKAYGLRTAFLLNKGTDPATVLREPDKVFFYTSKEAEDLGIYVVPKVLKGWNPRHQINP